MGHHVYVIRKGVTKNAEEVDFSVDSVDLLPFTKERYRNGVLHGESAFYERGAAGRVAQYENSEVAKVLRERKKD